MVGFINVIKFPVIINHYVLSDTSHDFISLTLHNTSECTYLQVPKCIDKLFCCVITVVSVIRIQVNNTSNQFTTNLFRLLLFKYISKRPVISPSLLVYICQHFIH